MRVIATFDPPLKSFVVTDQEADAWPPEPEDLLRVLRKRILERATITIESPRNPST